MGNVKTLFSDEARRGLNRGITKLNDAVKVTLGPRGRNVLMRKMHQGIHPTKDGVTVARRINFDDELENMGANLVKQAASATNDDAGDGTTTSTLLAAAMVNKGLAYLEGNHNASSVEIKRGMDFAVSQLVEILPDFAEPVGNDIQKIRNVAIISANNDVEIGGIIADSLETIGIDGYIKVSPSASNETYVDIVQGMQFDRGYSSPYFVTDQDTMQVIYDNGCDIVICEDKLTDRVQLEPILLHLMAEGKPLLLIANDFSQEFLGMAVIQKQKYGKRLVLVKSPYFGVSRDAYLDDLSVLVGATVMSEKAVSIEKLSDKHIGHVEKCLVTKDTTLLINGSGDKTDIANWIKYIEDFKPPSQKDEELKTERLSRLKGGIAVLHVGAASEAEVKEKRDRVDDALSATKAAIEEGIVEGGGIALLRLSSALVHYNFDKYDGENPGILAHLIESKDFNAGYTIVKDAIKEPFRQILINAGHSQEWIDKLEKSVTLNITPGINAATGKECNMFKEGIVDPAKVTRVALLNAVSVAGVVITTECVLIDDSLQKQESDLPAFLQD